MLNREEEEDYTYPFDWRRHPAVISDPKDQSILAVRCPLTTKLSVEQIALAGQRSVEQELASNGQLSIRASPVSRRQCRDMLRSHVRYTIVLDFLAPRSMLLSGMIHEAADSIYKNVQDNYPLAVSSVLIGITDETRTAPMATAELLVRTGERDHIDNDHAFLVSPNGKMEAAQLRHRMDEASAAASSFSGMRMKRPDRKREKFSPPPPPDWLVRVEGHKKREEHKQEEEILHRYQQHYAQLEASASPSAGRRKSVSGAFKRSSTPSHHQQQLRRFSSSASSPVSPSPLKPGQSQHNKKAVVVRGGSLPPLALHARLTAASFEPQRPLQLDRCGRCSKFDVDASKVVQEHQQQEIQRRIAHLRTQLDAGSLPPADGADRGQVPTSVDHVVVESGQQQQQHQQQQQSRGKNRAVVIKAGGGKLSAAASLNSLDASSRDLASMIHDDQQSNGRKSPGSKSHHDEEDDDHQHFSDATIGALQNVLKQVSKRQGLRSVFLLPKSEKQG